MTKQPENDAAAAPDAPTATGSQAPTTFDEAGRLNSTVLCVSCGHNLRGLLPSGVCTECASPVVAALRSPLTPADASRLRWAAGLTAATIPWLWLPLSWPAAYVAYWKLTARNATAQAGVTTLMVARYALFGTTAMAWALLLRGLDRLLLLLPATALLLMLFSFLVVLHLRNRYGPPELRRRGRLLVAVFVVSPLIAGAVVVLAAGSQIAVIHIAAWTLATLILLATPTAWLFAVIGLWRVAEAFEIQSQAGGHLRLLREYRGMAKASALPDADASATSSA